MRVVRHKFDFLPAELGGRYTDALLGTQEAAGRSLPVHRVLLAAVSARLRELFDEAPADGGIIVVRNIRFEVLEAVVSFVYSGKVCLADRDATFVEDFRDGLAMLRVEVGEKVDRKIADELKELKAEKPSVKRSASYEDENDNLKKPRASSGVGSMEGLSPDGGASPKEGASPNQGLESRRNAPSPVRGPERGGREEGCRDGREGSIRRELRGGKWEVQVKREEGEERSQGSPMNKEKRGKRMLELKQEPKEEEVEEMGHQGFDLRGKLVGNFLKGIRHSVEGRSPGEDWRDRRDREDREDKEDRRGREDRRTRERSSDRRSERSFDRFVYHFDPKKPRANPAWPANLQVMVGPLPGSISYQELDSALAEVGNINKLFLQFSNKYNPSKSKLGPNQFRFAYAVFKERASASRLLRAACVAVGDNYYGVSRLE